MLCPVTWEVSWVACACVSCLNFPFSFTHSFIQWTQTSEPNVTLSYPVVMYEASRERKRHLMYCVTWSAKCERQNPPFISLHMSSSPGLRVCLCVCVCVLVCLLCCFTWYNKQLTFAHFLWFLVTHSLHHQLNQLILFHLDLQFKLTVNGIICYLLLVCNKLHSIQWAIYFVQVQFYHQVFNFIILYSLLHLFFFLFLSLSLSLSQCFYCIIFFVVFFLHSYILFCTVLFYNLTQVCMRSQESLNCFSEKEKVSFFRLLLPWDEMARAKLWHHSKCLSWYLTFTL